jgi:uncharacterized protein YkwD
MLNRNPSNSSNVINSYRKRRMQKGPFLIYGAVALVIIGAIMLVIWLASPGRPIGALLATDTPTATLTFTPTSTLTPTITPTITLTPTITITFTPTGDQQYVIQEGDSLEAIAQRFNLGPDGSQIIYFANQQVMEDNGGVIFVGQSITIPPAGSTLPTTTPIPPDLPRGRLIEYRVLPGDTLAGIAAKFNSIADNIVEENDIENANALNVGQVLQIPVNLVTATATLPPTSTPVTPTVAGQATPTLAAATAASGATQASGGSAQCSFTENAAFVTELQTLINNQRTSNGQSALTPSTQLSAAAKAHAQDMICNNFFSHLSQTNNSTPQTRVANAGLTASLVVETIYAKPNASPSDALNWWKAQSEDNSAILNSNTTLIGVAYLESDQNLFGSYFVVVMAKP